MRHGTDFPLDNVRFFVAVFLVEVIGILLALAYWKLWGRDRFDRRIEAEVEARVARWETKRSKEKP